MKEPTFEQFIKKATDESAFYTDGKTICVLNELPPRGFVTIVMRDENCEVVLTHEGLMILHRISSSFRWKEMLPDDPNWPSWLKYVNKKREVE